MDIFQTLGKKDIRCMDSEIINHHMHIFSLITALACTFQNQEFVVLGLSKGSVILLHTRQIQRVFVRLTLHREAVINVAYLPNVKLFVSTCKGNYFKVWRCNIKMKKQEVLCDYRINKTC